MLSTLFTYLLAFLVILFVVAGLLGLFIWLFKGFRDMFKGKGPGSLPWL